MSVALTFAITLVREREKGTLLRLRMAPLGRAQLLASKGLACFTGIMMTVSVMGKTEAAVAGSSWGLMMPFAMVGGGMVPLMAMPGWLQDLSVVSPFKWAITAIEGAAWRGFTLQDQLLPCGVLLAIGVAFFSFGILVFRRIDG